MLVEVRGGVVGEDGWKREYVNVKSDVKGDVNARESELSLYAQVAGSCLT
jgi:hypothetical protein